VDGDTVDAFIDLGFDTHVKKRIRLYGMDAWESRTRDKEEKVKGLAAKARLIQILNENNNEFILVSHGVGKFGRCLGELFITSDSDSINNQLVLEGHAKKYNGGKR
tara:strand:- start:165 stop:482 length:318 start_codon:yes stop_codon:yes gene_type:complete